MTCVLRCALLGAFWAPQEAGWPIWVGGFTALYIRLEAEANPLLVHMGDGGSACTCQLQHLSGGVTMAPLGTILPGTIYIQTPRLLACVHLFIGGLSFRFC